MAQVMKVKREENIPVLSGRLVIFVDSVLGFLPWCNSNGVFFNPVCIVYRITFSARFMLSVRLLPFSVFAKSKFFIVSFALSTVPFPVCFRGGQ